MLFRSQSFGFKHRSKPLPSSSVSSTALKPDPCVSPSNLGLEPGTSPYQVAPLTAHACFVDRIDGFLIGYMDMDVRKKDVRISRRCPGVRVHRRDCDNILLTLCQTQHYVFLLL